MALHVPKAPGFAQMMKEGARVSTLCYNNRLKSHVFTSVGVSTKKYLFSLTNFKGNTDCTVKFTYRYHSTSCL